MTFVKGVKSLDEMTEKEKAEELERYMKLKASARKRSADAAKKKAKEGCEKYQTWVHKDDKKELKDFARSLRDRRKAAQVAAAAQQYQAPPKKA